MELADRPFKGPVRVDALRADQIIDSRHQHGVVEHQQLRGEDRGLRLPDGTRHPCRDILELRAGHGPCGAEPLTFGMTFPFSTHNYQLRFWMAAGGVDPDEDVRLVVLPPPYMVDSLANGQVDAFCVGAPWNSVAVDLGVGHILHFVSDIFQRAAEKVLAVREKWSIENSDVLARLTRAHAQAAEFIENPENRPEVSRILGAPERIGVDPEVVQRTLDGRLKISPDGTLRQSDRYLLVGRDHAARPDPIQAAWLYAQMVRWGQARYAPDALTRAKTVFRPDLYDAAHGLPPASSSPAAGVGAFDGTPFDAADIAGHLASVEIKHRLL